MGEREQRHIRPRARPSFLIFVSLLGGLQLFYLASSLPADVTAELVKLAIAGGKSA